jgi:endo-1,4-beta-mannosidase
MITRREFVKASVLGSAAAIASHASLAADALVSSSTPGAPRFGVNFVPRKHWWYCWLDWDQQAIADDLSGVAGLGLDHIRIQCLWPYFQPGVSNVSEHALANLHSLLDAADSAGLDVEVTVLNGWMSGLCFIPPWVAPLADPWNNKSGNIFTDRRVIDAEKLLFKKIADTIGGHRRFLGFDVGNELGVLMTPSSNPVSTAAADAWATEMLGYCDEIAPNKFHVNGVDHSHWFNDFGFSRENVATTGHASVVHSYLEFDGVLERYKYSDPAALHLAEYEVELAYAYQTDLSRRVWVEETGVGNKEMPESYKPEFMDHNVRNIMSTGKAWGVTWWCSHDIDPSIKSFDRYEYGLGLLDLENKPKPLGKKFAELADEFKRSRPEAVPRKTALVIPDRGLSTTAWPPDWKYATPYMNLIDRGVIPAIVLESRSKDEDYLRARGITDLIQSGT